MQSVISTRGLDYSYGRVQALRSVNIEVPEGSVYALIGPNGAGKTTLLSILMGLQRPDAGAATVLGRDAMRLEAKHRADIGYVSGDQRLPSRMTLAQLEAYLAPLYPSWDHSLANDLRTAFRLDARRRPGALSRGEHMKAALLCALAPRPRLLVMDEPFTGLDVVVKDDLVRGLLETSGRSGWTVLISSHDLAELEALADWVGYLDDGRLLVSESMELLLERFGRVEILLDNAAAAIPRDVPADWLAMEHAGARVTFVTSAAPEFTNADSFRRWFPDAIRIEIRPVSLREIFVALARAGSSATVEVAS